jgi:hypothetical protein
VTATRSVTAEPHITDNHDDCARRALLRRGWKQTRVDAIEVGTSVAILGEVDPSRRLSALSAALCPTGNSYVIPIHSDLRKAGRLGLLSLVLAMAGCLGGEEIDFEVCGDLMVPDDIDALRFLVLDDDMEEVSAGVRDLVGDSVASLPVSASLPSGSGSGWTRVQGLKAGVAAIVFSRRIGDLDGTSAVDMVLTYDCLGQDCSLGQTCVSGTCILAPVGNEAPGCGGSF